MLMKRMLKFGLVVLVVFAMARASHAEIASIAIAPITRTLVLSKGGSHDGTYIVYNTSDEPQHVYVEPRYWYMVQENEKIPLESWLNISPLEFDIGPKEKKEVKFNVLVPEGAAGELATMIAFRPKPKEDQAVNVVFSVSLYVRVTETEVIDCIMSDFEIRKFEDRKALKIKLDMRNRGNVHIKPRITVYVEDLFNKLLQKADLKFGMPTYPGTDQDYHGAIYDFKLKPGIYKARIEADYTNVARRFYKRIYFIVGRDGKVILTLFRKPRG